jgi:hypothetical protein
MSTARTHRKSSRDNKAAQTGHAFRNALIISLALAALVLWQLSWVIHGLNTLASLLGRVLAIRRFVAEYLAIAYQKAITLVLPLMQRIAQR